ncbi:MAG: hypothetical protein J1G06_09880 [Oscillospiraceae bacterium]|nr:hypothetical protein [Oscillospiraceae bacterium]
MKGLKRNIASIMVVLSMAFTLFGCVGLGGKSSDKEKFIGSWKAKIDVADVLNNSMKQGDSGMADYVNIDKFEFVFLFTFNDDGTYSIAADRDSIEENLDAIKPDIKKGIIEYLEGEIEKSGLGITVDEMLEITGNSLDDMIDENFKVSMFDSSFESMETEGKWKVENEKLYMNKGTNGDFDDDDAVPYEFISEGIKLSAPEDADEDYLEMMFPMILKKVN